MLFNHGYSQLKDPLERRLTYQKRKLIMLEAIRDSLERKMASINASIETIKVQIERDSVSTDKQRQ